MRTSKLCLLVAFALCATATPASAYVAHTVQPGETLWSIAAASNLTTRTLAAANGLPEDAQVVLGSTIQIPSEQEGAAALAAAGPAPARPRLSRERPSHRPPRHSRPAPTRCSRATRWRTSRRGAASA